MSHPSAVPAGSSALLLPYPPEQVGTADLMAVVWDGRGATPPEPPAGHPLWRAPRTLISPHVGGHGSAFLPRASRLIRSRLERFLAGEPLANVVTGPAG